MSKIERITLIFTIISFVLVFLLGSQGLILKPFFSVTVDDSSPTIVKIQNIGMAQAKDAIVHISSTIPLKMTQNTCIENSKLELNEKQMLIHFVRLSTGISCTIYFEGKIKYDLEYVTVSSEDAAGLEWTPYVDLFSRLFWLQIGTYGAVISLISAVIGTIISSYIRRQTKNKVKIYRTKEEEVREEIRLIEDELNFLQKRLSETTDADLINSITRRIRFLDDRMRVLYLELDQAKSSIILEGRLENIVGEFYINWTELEQQILRIAEHNQIDTVRMNIHNLVRELQRREIFSKELIDNFNELRKFRNGLVHGFISPRETYLKDMNSKLKKLLSSIKELNERK